MATCHSSFVQLKSASPVVVLRSSVAAFAQDAAALHASKLDLGSWFSHHSSTLSRASSHFFASLSSTSNACRRILLSCHRSCRTLVITSSLSTNILRCSPGLPGCARVGACAQSFSTTVAVCRRSLLGNSGSTRGHLCRWLSKSLLRHQCEQYITFSHLAHGVDVVASVSTSSPHDGHQALLGVHAFP